MEKIFIAVAEMSTITLIHSLTGTSTRMQIAQIITDVHELSRSTVTATYVPFHKSICILSDSISTMAFVDRLRESHTVFVVAGDS